MSELSRYFSIDNGFSMSRATQDDVDELVPLINEAFAYQYVGTDGSRTDYERLPKCIDETELYVVKDDKSAVVGCVYIKPDGDALHFGLLALAPEYRGKGIAARMIRSIENYAKENNFASLELDYVSVAPGLKTYYERYGFAETGEVEEWGAVDLRRMRKVVG